MTGFETKVTDLVNNLHTEHAPFIFEQFDDKLPDWDLNANVFLQKLQEKVMQYHPGKKPKEGSYTDASTDTIRQCEFVVVVRLFIDTQNRLVTLHSVLIKTHEETDNSPNSVIYRPVGSTKQCFKEISLVSRIL